MAKKLYSAKQLKEKFKGQYINTQPIYSYENKEWFYEVHRTSKIIRENCNPPEDEIIEHI